jgi:LacI family transcriptional regulator
VSQRIRIKDIAERANVSTGTVDRVLHERGKVAPEVRQRVLEVMEEMGFERNAIASALAYNRTWRFATLMPDPKTDVYWAQPNTGIEQAIRSVRHYGIVHEPHYYDAFSPADFVRKAEAMLQNPPDGLLFAPVLLKESNELLHNCEQLQIPIVTINTYIKDGPYLAYIGQDSYQSGVLAGRLLHFGLQSGSTAALLNLDVGSHNAKHLIDKEQGFREYFARFPEQKINIVKEDFEDFMDKRKLRRFLSELLEANKELHGIFVTNSRAYRVIDALPVSISQHLKIVGFDLVPPNLEHLRRNNIDFLINQNPVEQGYLGIISLFNHLLKKKNVENLQYLPLDIVVTENVDYYLRRQKEMVV